MNEMDERQATAIIQMQDWLSDIPKGAGPFRTAAHFLVMQFLIRRCDPSAWNTWSREKPITKLELERGSHISTRTLERVIQDLEAGNAIRREFISGHASQYWVNKEPIIELGRPARLRQEEKEAELKRHRSMNFNEFIEMTEHQS